MVIKEKNYWLETVTTPPAQSARDLPDSIDVVVVGGGFCGLSAARTLAKRGVKVAVLEADTFGWGARRPHLWHRSPLPREQVAGHQRHHAHHQRRNDDVEQPGAAPGDTERSRQIRLCLAQLPRGKHRQHRYPRCVATHK